MSESIKLIFGNTMRLRKKSDFLLPPTEIGSSAMGQVTRGLVAKYPAPLRKGEHTRPQMNEPLKVFAPFLKIIPRFIIDEETRTQSVFPHMEASYSVGRRKILQVKVTVKWILPNQRPKQSLCGFGGDQAYITKRNIELMSRETAKASRPHKSLMTSDKIDTLEMSQNIMPSFVTDEELRAESIFPQLEASFSKGTRKLLKMSVTVKWSLPSICLPTQIYSLGNDQALRRDKHGRVKIVSEATNSDASRQQKSQRLSHVLFARNVDAVELVSVGTAKTSRPLNINKSGKIDTIEQSRYVVPLFIFDEEQKTESVSPQLEASFSGGRRKLLKMSVTVKWGFPSNFQATQIDSLGNDQALCRERNGLSFKVFPKATNLDAFRRQKSPRLSHVLFARNVDAVELAEETVNASMPHKSLKMLDEIVTVEQSRYFVPQFVTDSISPQLKALDSFVDDQALCRERHGHVNIVSEATHSNASRRQKSPRLSNDVPAKDVDTVELVLEGSAKASGPHKSLLKIPEEIVTVEQSRLIVPRFVMDAEKRTESVSPQLEASFSKGRRKLLKIMSVTVKWGIPGKREEKLKGSVVDDLALCRERHCPPLEVLSEVTNSDASRRRKSPRLSHFQVNEVIFAWDKGHLYEAMVSRWRDAKDGSTEYFVHYLGFGKSHDRWLATKDMMKLTPSTQEFYITNARPGR